MIRVKFQSFNAAAENVPKLVFNPKTIGIQSLMEYPQRKANYNTS